MSNFIKDPEAKLDYQWDWTNYLASDETITDHTIDDDGLTASGDSSDGKKVTVWFEDGDAGKAYNPRCEIITSKGRIDVRTMTIQVRDR